MKNITLILLTLSMLNWSCKAQNNTMKDYEKATDTIINQIIALKSKHPEQLSTIKDARIEKEITTEKFWKGFHYEKGKHIVHLSGIKKTEGVVSFEEDGIELHIYFFKGKWTGTATVNIIPFGNLNCVVFIENDNNGLYQDIEKIIIAEREKLEKTISREEAILIAKNDANGFLGTWVDCSLKNGNWHIKASSKSANPPKYYVIDAKSGEILLRLDNTDNPTQKEKLNTYLNHPQKNIMEDYKKAIELAEKLMIEKKLILDEYNLVKIQNQFLYGEDKGKAATSVWKIIYLVKRTDGEDVYMIRGGEIFIEVDLKTKTAKITGWSE